MAAVATPPKPALETVIIFDPTRVSRYEVSQEILSFPDSSRPVAKDSKIEAIFMEKLILTFGVNTVKSSLLDLARKHPQSKKRLEELEASGAVRYFTPDAEILLSCSSDYTKPADAIEITRFNFDKAWLEQSQRREDRKAVLKAVNERLAQLNSTTRRKSPGEDMSGFSLI